MLRNVSFIAVLFATMSINALADTNIIIHAVPPNREIVAPPRPDLHCRIVPATYQHGIWKNQYRVCESARHRGMWTSGYWQCTHLKHHNTKCAHWEWVPSHWEGQQVVIYRPSVQQSQPRPVVAYEQPPRQSDPVPVLPPEQHQARSMVVDASPQRQSDPVPVLSSPQPPVIQVSISR